MLMRSAASFRRIKVTATDVIKPFAIMMTANLILLAVWTAVSPLEYQRIVDYYDEYGRAVSSHGSCSAPDDSGAKGGAIPYVALLAVINLCPVILANIQVHMICIYYLSCLAFNNP